MVERLTRIFNNAYEKVRGSIPRGGNVFLHNHSSSCRPHKIPTVLARPWAQQARKGLGSMDGPFVRRWPSGSSTINLNISFKTLTVYGVHTYAGLFDRKYRLLLR